MNICRRCGSVLRDGDKYCSKCGARAPSEKARERKQKAKKRKQQKEITFQTKPAHSRGYRENFEEGENRSHALLVTVTILVVMMLAVAAFAMFYFLKKRSLAGGIDYSSAIEIITGDSAEAINAAGSGEGADPVDAGAQPEDAEAQAANGEAQAGNGEAQAASGEAQAGNDEAQPENQEAQPQDGEAKPEGGAALPQSEGAQSQSEEGKPQSEEVQPESESAQPLTEESEQLTETESETETPPETERVTPSASDAVDPAQIQSILENESTASSAEVYIYDLKHDSEAAYGDCSQPMYASALITVPILYTAASQIDAGAITLDDPIPYVTSIGGRGELTTEQRDGQEYPLSFYLQTMTNYSDNNCINVLIDYLGLDTINSVCQEAGYSSVNMERGLVSGDPGGLDNYVSAKDVTMMVKNLYSGAFSSIGTDFMKNYFHINEGDSLPTLVGLAPDLADADAVLNQNGHGMTRYNETAVIEDQGAQYILTIMLYGDSGMVYSPAVTDVAEYVSTAMAG